MQIAPKKIKYINSFKLRKLKNPILNSYLLFGNIGFKSLSPLTLTSKQLVKFTLALKRSARKSEKTRRFYWIKAFPHLPLTKKPKGVRMGKGKGKRFLWYTTVQSNFFIFELSNIRYGRMLYHSKHVKIVFPKPLILVQSNTHVFNKLTIQNVL
jgi:large subunit ribosomal protein L16